jgi:c-di-GMP-binding flagellar brake protein YcgR
MSGEEQRVHTRIQVSTSIEVRRATGGERLTAVLKDLSKGGARFVVPTSVGKAGDEIELFLPSLSGPDITVNAQIIRATAGNDGETIACRFDEVAADMRQALLDLIEVLLSTSAGQARRHARVARRMDITFGDLEELRGILDDIMAGGLAMTVVTPLVLYEELDITVPDTNGDQLLILHARVINQRVLPITADDEEMLYRVNLEMSPLRPETRRCLEGVLQTVLELLPSEEKKGA